MDGIILSETKNDKNVLCTLAVLLIILFMWKNSSITIEMYYSRKSNYE